MRACRYAKESKLLFKVAGHADSVKQQADAGSVELHGTMQAGKLDILASCPATMRCKL